MDSRWLQGGRTQSRKLREKRYTQRGAGDMPAGNPALWRSRWTGCATRPTLACTEQIRSQPDWLGSRSSGMHFMHNQKRLKRSRAKRYDCHYAPRFFGFWCGRWL